MRLGAKLLLVAACDRTDELPTPGVLELTFEAEQPPSPALRFEELALVVNDVTFDGHLDSVLLLLQAEPFHPLDAPDEAITLEVERDRHLDCQISVSLVAHGGSPAILATGFVSTDDDLDDARRFHLEVDDIDLTFPVGTVGVDSEPWSATIRLFPAAWIEGLPRPDDDETLRITPGSGAAYGRLRANILTSTVLDPDGDAP